MRYATDRRILRMSRGRVVALYLRLLRWFEHV